MRDINLSINRLSSQMENRKYFYAMTQQLCLFVRKQRNCYYGNLFQSLNHE